MEEFLDIVDENGNLTGKRELRSVCHEKGFWHQTVHIYFFRKKDQKLQFLVHLRSKLKDLNPNKWDTRFGGHLKAGQSVDDAIVNEIKEETGIETESQNIIKSFCEAYDGKTNREYVYINYYNFTGKISELSFDDGEVQEVKWMSSEEIENSISTDPDSWSASLSGFQKIKNDLLAKI